ncbi:hypothetical protein Patl1_21533 [Pistacia atlantica]|uniref:Uncharacterized protein n=1 Tax=Pistacia atlantica TaxID=434234 RepID=A0ACC1BMF7_9ROSI|nr:hypothetical protein Patl1_21533 [Pistacia atlantica]
MCPLASTNPKLFYTLMIPFTQANNRFNFDFQLDSSTVRSIRGMDSVVATVSGYHGSERFKLIKLISEAGASYVGAMSRSTTHLVCWKFEGKKYDLAKKFKTIVVNHRWVEDCIKQRTRVPEAPYMLQCGQEIGPLSMELPIVTKKHSVFSDQSYRRLGGDSETEDDMDSKGSDLAAWTDSFLLNENFLLKFENSNSTSHTSKAKPLKRTSKKEQRSSARYCFQEPPLSGLVSMENEESSSDSSIHSTRGKRKISKQQESSTSFLQSEREKRQISKVINTTLVKPPELEGTSNDRFHQLGEIDEGFEETEDIEDRNHQRALERVSRDGCTDFDNLNGENLVQPEEFYLVDIDFVIHASKTGPIICFVSITKVEDAATSDQKIYSQTIPCALPTTDIFFVTDRDRPGIGAQPSLLPSCSECRSREPEELLVRCHLCQIRCIHSYCLDPPLFPWTCIYCKDLQMLYHHSY